MLILSNFCQGFVNFLSNFCQDIVKVLSNFCHIFVNFCLKCLVNSFQKFCRNYVIFFQRFFRQKCFFVNFVSKKLVTNCIVPFYFRILENTLKRSLNSFFLTSSTRTCCLFWDNLRSWG